MTLILTYVMKIMILSDFQQVLAVALYLLKNYSQSKLIISLLYMKK